MVKMVLFPWFFIRLFVSILPTVLEIAWIPVRRWENGLISLVVVFFIGAITITLYPTLVPLPGPVLQSVTTVLQPNQRDMEKQLELHLALHRQQPTDRDILINLALLYRGLGQSQTAETYWSQAQKIDPNYGLFQ